VAETGWDLAKPPLSAPDPADVWMFAVSSRQDSVSHCRSSVLPSFIQTDLEPLLSLLLPCSPATRRSRRLPPLPPVAVPKLVLSVTLGQPLLGFGQRASGLRSCSPLGRVARSIPSSCPGLLRASRFPSYFTQVTSAWSLAWPW